MSGLYIHFPFCRSKCGYCGFYSVSEYGMMEKYLSALRTDIASRPLKKYDTLYIGGGTPSSVPPLILAGFLDSLPQKSFSESTIEANPESITDDFLSVVREFGFTRVSLGCQSTDDGVLKHLGRIHTSADVFNSVEKIRKFCPGTALNLDMIYDIPSSDNSLALRTLSDIISLSPEHVSAYTYSFDTEFLKNAQQHEESLFLSVKHELMKAGYGKYEISNFAVKGCESRHNINYWKLGDYDGIGSAAWSLINLPDKRILSGKPADLHSYTASPADFESQETTEGTVMMLEELVFGLRMLDGVDFSGLNIKYGGCTEIVQKPIKTLCDEGFSIWKGQNICLTEKGELLLDSVQEFLWGCLP